MDIVYEGDINGIHYSWINEDGHPQIVFKYNGVLLKKTYRNSVDMLNDQQYKDELADFAIQSTIKDYEDDMELERLADSLRRA